MHHMSWNGRIREDYVRAGICTYIYIARELNSTTLPLFSPQRITAHLHALKTPPYVVNLDPAVSAVPYPANIGRYLWIPMEHVPFVSKLAF